MMRLMLAGLGSGRQVHAYRSALANALTTCLFVIAHMIAREPMAGALVLLPSIYLGLLRQRYGGAGICMVIHAVWNVGWFSVFPPI